MLSDAVLSTVPKADVSVEVRLVESVPASVTNMDAVSLDPMLVVSVDDTAVLITSELDSDEVICVVSVSLRSNPPVAIISDVSEELILVE